MEQSSQYLTISQLSSLLNIARSTLRFWEKEFPMILAPLRTKGGQRRYAQEHIAVIEKINAHKRSGLSLAEIKRELKQGQMSGIENQMSGDERMQQIDLLAERVAKVVKMEVLRFIQKG